MIMLSLVIARNAQCNYIMMRPFYKPHYVSGLFVRLSCLTVFLSVCLVRVLTRKKRKENNINANVSGGKVTIVPIFSTKGQSLKPQDIKNRTYTVVHKNVPLLFFTFLWTTV